ncbi:MAG: hypothetical protein CMM50_02645 [Rhodospirillaceae bacterium]|nr:hypothetical protein [Rhodospirillaceae bacterium]|tara:strand:+ start:548 stop:739 length:192 start_codon:yes stop_codon:yes gene_type:complete
MLERAKIVAAFGFTALGTLVGMAATAAAGHPEHMVTVSVFSGLLASTVGWLGARPRANAVAEA